MSEHQQHNDQYRNADLEERIDRYVKGELDQQEVDRLWADLVKEPEYLDYLRTVANLQHIVREEAAGYKTMAGETPEHETTQQQASVHEAPASAAARVGMKKVWLSTAAAVVLTVSILGLLLWFTPGGEGNDEIGPLASLELHNVRSAVEPGMEMEARLQESITEAARGNTGQALELLEQMQAELAEDDPFLADVHLNKGIIFYNDGRMDRAGEAFRAVIERRTEDPLMEEKAWWYLGNVHLQLGEQQQAVEAIREAYEINGAYRRITERYLQELEGE